MSNPAEFIYFDGKIQPWEEARVHVFTPLNKYGVGVFEGVRGYWNAEQEQLFTFRMKEHMRRLELSQIAMRYDTVVDAKTIGDQVVEVIRANNFRETVHARAMVYIDGLGEMDAAGPVALTITAVPRPLPKKVAVGCKVQVSSWQRISDRAMPPRIKANANYQNARLAIMQATHDGYDTALFLNDRGKVSEGPGMCLFMLRDGIPVTPTVTSDILESITRDTILQLLEERLGKHPIEREIDRSELIAAEELFFCGTGWEITPIINVDGFTIGSGTPGPLTKELQTVYFDTVHSRIADYRDWCRPVYSS